MARRYKAGRSGSLRSISDILVGAYPGRTDDLTLIRTFSWWERAVSRRIAEVARPVRLSHGTLYVHVRSSVWAQELTFHEEELLASVRRVVPSVRRIRIKVGPMPPPGQAPDPPPPETEPLAFAELPGDVARALARVSDDEVREALTRAACMQLGSLRTGAKKK
ncbi:MAG: DUF721 domain-containing protein [Myxococcales bacterium]|nr:DUF721 domain-containing protein [Myxococcales bacterium]